MEYAIHVIMLVLGVFRITYIIKYEKIGETVRKLAGEYEIRPLAGISEDGPVYTAFPDTFFGNLINCFRCLSVWTGVASTIVWYFCPWLLYPFAASQLAIWMNEDGTD